VGRGAWEHFRGTYSTSNASEGHQRKTRTQNYDEKLSKTIHTGTVNEGEGGSAERGKKFSDVGISGGTVSERKQEKLRTVKETKSHSKNSLVQEERTEGEDENAPTSKIDKG